MGADIYLESIFKTFDHEAAAQKAIAMHPDDPRAAAEEAFNFMRATGGYFRNGYNSGDVMWAIGLSWYDTVQPMLDTERRLPIARARDLVTMIEERPLTRERVARHIFENMTNGAEPHPVMGSMHTMIKKAAVEATGVPWTPLEPPDFDVMFGFLTERREQLLAILRKSIALNEPLICDL